MIKKVKKHYLEPMEELEELGFFLPSGSSMASPYHYPVMINIPDMELIEEDCPWCGNGWVSDSRGRCASCGGKKNGKL